MQLFKILVVDDFEPFRRFIVSELKGSTQYQIIGQASDGLEAVQRARDLQPDLILLDISLPKLTGIEVAKRIHQFAPRTKILFVSLAFSPDLVREALRLRGVGYIHKLRAGSELLPAIEAMLAGGHFVGSGLQAWEFAEAGISSAPHHHEVLFYSNDAALIESLTDFIAAALKAGNPAIVMATKSHQEGLFRGLRSEGLDTDGTIQEGRYIALDASDVISQIVVNDVVDRDRFLEGIRGFIESACKAARLDRPRVALAGEVVGLLWAKSQSDAAVLLEKVGNELSDAYEVDILCAYPMEARLEEAVYKKIRLEHSAAYFR